MCVHTYLLVIFIDTLNNETAVCRGSDVNVKCGYFSINSSYVEWIINGMLLNESALHNNLSYLLNNLNYTLNHSLTIFSINETTTFQCVVHTITNVTEMSSLGTVTVIGMY